LSVILPSLAVVVATALASGLVLPCLTSSTLLNLLVIPPLFARFGDAGSDVAGPVPAS
jgi:hypothetical protein